MDEADGPGGLGKVHEARRRIVAAFEGITAASEALARRAAEAPDPRELARLRAEIDEERIANAQLAERVRLLHQRGSARHDARVAELEASLVQALDELAELRARREADRAELDAVLGELLPLIEEAG